MMEQLINGVWALRQGPEHNHIDGRTHVHHIHLFNQVTGGEHNIQFLLHVPTCRECGRAFERKEGALDIGAAISAEIGILEANHARVMTHAKASGVPIKLGELATIVPEGHRVTFHGPYRMLRAK